MELQEEEKDNWVKHFFAAFRYSVQGFKSCFRTEMAFRMELAMIAVLFPLAFLIAQSLVEFLLLVGTLFILVIAELLNTAIENVIDKTIPQQSSRAGMAKDQGSAAVFTALTFIGVVYISLIVYNWEAIIRTVSSLFS
ncbi:MAG: diacylglycerol kinase [bacterium]|nr:diacylglycerol kinase [bacterium]